MDAQAPLMAPINPDDIRAAVNAAPREALEAVVTQVLTDVGWPAPEMSEPGAAAMADTFARLLVDAWNVNEYVTKVDQDLSVIYQKVSQRSLWALPDGDGGYRLPWIQFGSDGVTPIPGLAEVLRALPVHVHPVSVLGFLTTPNLDLPSPDGDTLTVLDWLQTGGDSATPAALAHGLTY